MVHESLRQNRPQYYIKYQTKSKRTYGQHGKQDAHNGCVNPQVSAQSTADATQNLFVAVPVQGAAGGGIGLAIRRLGG